MSRRGLLLFLAAGVAWGLPYMFIRFADRDFSVPMIVFSRVLIGSIVLIPLALKRGALIPALKRWRVVLVFALLEMVGPWWLITSAENGHITSGLAGLLIATVPFFSIPIAFFYMGDKSVTHPKTLIGLVIGFLGVFVLVGIDAVTTNLDVGWVLLVILAAIGYSIAPAIAAKMAPEVHSSGIISHSAPSAWRDHSVSDGLGLARGARRGLLGGGVCHLLRTHQRDRLGSRDAHHLPEHRLRNRLGHNLLGRATDHRHGGWVSAGFSWVILSRTQARLNELCATRRLGLAQ